MNFIRVTSADEVEILKNYFGTTPLALDCESTDKNPRIAELLTVVLTVDGITAYSIPAKFLPLLSFLKDNKRLTLQNFKYDYHLLYLHGLDLSTTPCFDIMLLHHLIDETKEHGLDAMVKEEFNDNYKQYFWEKYKTFAEAPPNEALEYECKDAIYTFRLKDIFLKRLHDRTDLIDHVHSLAMSLYSTEVHGLRVDPPLMLKTKEEMGGRIATYLPRLREEFADPCNAWELNKWLTEMDKRKTPKGKSQVPRPQFNFGSNAQVQWLLYTHLRLPVLKKTEAGLPSTDYETIEKLEADHPILKTYKDYIDIKTIYGTFVEGLIERVEDGRIYPAFNVNGTVTGRISHSNPNMGNMPKEGPYRNFFLPDEGHSIVGADYTQLEVVIEANLTGDKNLAKIILEGASKHDITAQGLKVTRDLAKTINFAMGYHCGVRKLSKLLKCSYPEAEYQWNKYWEIYKGCRDLKLLTDAEVDAGLPIKNLVGRYRHLTITKDMAEWQVEGMKRQAYNFKIQGPGGDFMNKSFYRTASEFTKRSLGRMLFTVHDEGVGSAITARWEEAVNLLIHHMEALSQEYGLKIPLKAKGYGPLARWAKT